MIYPVIQIRVLPIIFDFNILYLETQWRKFLQYEVSCIVGITMLEYQIKFMDELISNVGHSLLILKSDITKLEYKPKLTNLILIREIDDQVIFLDIYCIFINIVQLVFIT